MDKKIIKEICIFLVIIVFSIFFFNSDLLYNNDKKLQLITKQSYPHVGGEWITKIKTSGLSDLQIFGYNGTYFNKDVEYIEVICNNDIYKPDLINNGIEIKNYSCSGITYIKNKVLTTGKHNLLINFSDESVISKNLATILRVYNMANRATYGHYAYEKGAAAPTNPFNFNAEATNTDYTNIESDNNVYWDTSRALTDNTYDSQIYHFNITEDYTSILEMNVTWKGYSSEIRTGYDMSFFIWNNNSGSWELIQQDTNGDTSEVSWTGSFNSNLDYYVDNSSGENMIYLYSRFEHYLAPISCPFVYSYNGENYTLEHEAFPFSVIKAAEAQTNDRLEFLEEVDGEYKIKIREELEENSFLNYFALYVVDHNGSGFAMPDVNGKMHVIEDLQSPVSCYDDEGYSCLKYVSSADNVFLSDNFLKVNVSDKSTFKDEYIVEFENNKSSDIAKLYLRVQKQSIMTKAWSFYSTSIGWNFWHFWQALISNTFLGDLFNFAFDNAVNLKIEVETNGGFREVGSVKAGMHMLDEFLYEVNLSDVDTDKIRFKLSSIKGFYEIDTMKIDFTSGHEIITYKLEPKSAILNGKDDVIYNISKDDNSYASLFKHDEIDLVYDAIEKKDNLTRDYALSIKGYYNFINFKDQDLIGFLKGIYYWAYSLLFPQDIPKILYDNIEDRDSIKHNTLYSDYVEVVVESVEGLKWNQSSFDFGEENNSETSFNILSFNATNFNSNVKINSTGNGTDFITINQTIFSDMNHSDFYFVNISCSPQINISPGHYTAIFNLTSNQLVTGDLLTVICDVVDNINPIVVDILPVENTTFIDPIEINLSANVSDNINVSSVRARIEYNSTVDIVTLLDLDFDGIYNYTFTFPAYNGLYNITILANDTSNNTNNTQRSYFYVRDEFAPNITLQYPNSSIGYSYEFEKEINITIDEPNSIDFNISFTNESPARIIWFKDLIEITSNENSTTFSFPGNYSSQGNYTIKVNVSNSAGFDYRLWNLEVNNVSEPQMVVSSPLNITYSTDLILINFTTTFSTPDALWYFNGTDNISYTIPNVIGVGQGSHTFTFYGNNTAGDILNETVSFFVDSIFPILSVYSPLFGFLNSSNVIVNFSANDTNLDSLWYFNGTNNVSYTTMQSLILPDGNYTFIFYANDTAGNINSTQVNFTIDTTPPVLNVISPVNSDSYLPGFLVLINVSATDLYLDEIWYFNGTDNVSYSGVQYLNLTTGFYTFDFYANDSVGNVAVVQVNFSVENKQFYPVFVNAKKDISIVNTNLALVNLSVRNNIANATNVTLFDFVGSDFVDGSYSNPPDNTDVVNGFFSGEVNYWNISLGAFEYVNITYLVTGTGNYRRLENFMFGVE